MFQLPYKVVNFSLRKENNKYILQEWEENHSHTFYIKNEEEISESIFRFINSLFLKLKHEKEDEINKVGKEKTKEFLCKLVDKLE